MLTFEPIWTSSLSDRYLFLVRKSFDISALVIGVTECSGIEKTPTLAHLFRADILFTWVRLQRRCWRTDGKHIRKRAA